MAKDVLPQDIDGAKTLEFIRNVSKRVARITGVDSVSLGLHPAVYFYTLGGLFQPTAFLSTIELFDELSNENKLLAFSKARKQFEEFLVVHKDFSSQLVHKRGSGGRSRSTIKDFYRFVLDAFVGGSDDATVMEKLKASPTFSFLVVGAFDVPLDGKKDFSRGAKTAVFLRDALASAVRCAICGARLHRNSIHIDHVERKREGGIGAVDNAQLAHPFCDSTVKG